MPTQLLAALAGLGFGLSLIVAIGAQNAFVLRQGLIRNHVLIIVTICAVADAALIFAGLAGLGALITSVGWLLPAIELVGGLFVGTYGVLAARRALSSESLAPTGETAGLTVAVAVTTTLGLTLLNPHVYLDTVLLLGSVASTYGINRWWFGLGAAIADHPCDPAGRVRTREGTAIAGLYVGDGSLFPTGLGVNPMITIMALARRVARTVAGEGRAGG